MIETIKESRKSQRIVADYDIRFGVGGSVHTGQTRDFSSGGMFIRSGIIFPPGTKMDIELSLPDGKMAILCGIVVWTKETPSEENDGALRRGMGIRILYASGGYQQFIEEKA